MEEEVKKPESVEFNPKAKYGWKNDAIFTLNGKDFSLILNALRGQLSTPEAKRFFDTMQAAEVAENLLIKAVQNGSATEVKKEKPE